MLVKFKAASSPEDIDRALRALRARPDSTALTWAGDVATYRDSQEMNAEVLAEKLASQPEVDFAEPNYLYRHRSTPNDPSFGSRQWNLTALDMPRAWDLNPGGRTATVAIIDYGITTTTASYPFVVWNGQQNESLSIPFAVSPDLNTARFVSPTDFAFWSGPVLDMDGHGTHVASTIGEDTNNGLAEAGIAYQARIMPLKACVGHWEVQFVLSASGFRGTVPVDAGGCSTSAIATAIRFAADNGANVINISLGGPSRSATLRDALAYATGKGVFVAVANGNSYEDGNAEEFPAGYAPELGGLMSVGAVGRTLKRAFYSSVGRSLEISAPGGDSRSDGAAGVIWQVTVSAADSDPEAVLVPRFDRYQEQGFQGTSMASPHVAGVAALLYSQGVTNGAAIEHILKATAKDLGSSGQDEEYGYGLAQPRAALLGVGLLR
ncbi:MAG: S8 family serine peptidase [Vicinamibacterales bacterium]